MKFSCRDYTICSLFLAAPKNRPKDGLFCFFVHGVLFAPLAEFVELKTVFQSFLVLVALIPNTLALFAFQFDEIIL